MNLHALNIVLAVVGAVGIPTAIVLAIFAPAVLESIVSLFLNVMGRILGTRLGVGIVVGLICLIIGELYGTHQANLQCRTTIIDMEKAADEAAVKRDQEQATVTDTDVQGRVGELEALNKDNEVKIHDYEVQLATRKNSVCLITPDDLLGGLR